MKRYILSLFLLSAITVTAYTQSLELSNKNGIITPNSTIIQEGSPDSAELVTYMNVKNIGDKEINVLCKKSQLTMLDSTETTMCWAGSCYPSDVNISPNSRTIAVGEIVTDFDGRYVQIAFDNFKPGESFVRWVFYDEANVNDSNSVTIKYTSYPLGIDDASAAQTMLSNAFPNPAGASAGFTYSIPAGSIGTFTLRNVIGSTIQVDQLQSSTGKFIISTTNLSDGIYFYSLMVDGKLSQTKKLIVKH
ncbi:MAG: T9SS type A sorting domain-containing protein [Bacteroidales bacterium]